MELNLVKYFYRIIVTGAFLFLHILFHTPESIVFYGYFSTFQICDKYHVEAITISYVETTDSYL